MSQLEIDIYSKLKSHFMTTYKMQDRLRRTPCERCVAIKKNEEQCRNMTCKWSPMCWAHRQVDVQESTIPNVGEGGFARVDLKKGNHGRAIYDRYHKT